MVVGWRGGGWWWDGGVVGWRGGVVGVGYIYIGVTGWWGPGVVGRGGMVRWWCWYWVYIGIGVAASASLPHRAVHGLHAPHYDLEQPSAAYLTPHTHATPYDIPHAPARIDVFAVRQWPGNGADLDFRGVLEGCAAAIVAAAPIEGTLLKDLKEWWHKKAAFLKSDEYNEVAKVLPFCRLWCVHAAGRPPWLAPLLALQAARRRLPPLSDHARPALAPVCDCASPHTPPSTDHATPPTTPPAALPTTSLRPHPPGAPPRTPTCLKFFTTYQP